MIVTQISICVCVCVDQMREAQIKSVTVPKI